MHMQIKGPLDRLLASVLPHEITHTVFAHYFRCPVPRWADEGGSVLSEDDIERRRHDTLVRGLLNQGRQIRMRTLFSLREYPRDVMCLYAQGFSMTDFLVKRSDRRTFLKFIAHGMNHGWDNAVQTYYRHRSVEELEEAWLASLRDGRTVQPDTQIAAGQRYEGRTTGGSSTMVRLTAPPVQPGGPAPGARAAMPTPEQMGQRFGGAPVVPAAAQPALPPPPPPPSPVGSGWQPVVQPVPAASPGQQPYYPPPASPGPQQASAPYFPTPV